MPNCNMTVKGNVLTISIDLSQEQGMSASGKSILIGSTHGNQHLDGKFSNVSVGVNVYKKA